MTKKIKREGKDKSKRRNMNTKYLIDYMQYKEKVISYEEGVKDTVKALRIILDEDSASIGMLCRYAGFTYSKGASILDKLEGIELIGPYKTAIPRKVLVKWKEAKKTKKRHIS
jgi:hypothetical protein